jgi:uncharacterized phage protein (TIGR02218 family)
MSSLNKIVTCWQIKLSNDKIFNFTDADEDFIYDDESYLSGSYFTPGSISSFNELAQDNFTISGVIDDKYITYEMIVIGDLSEAYIEVFLVDLEKLEESKVILKTGWIGEIKYSNNSYTAEIISIGGKTNNIIGNCYSSSCRAEFGSKYCGMAIEKFTYKGVITSVISEGCFFDESRVEPDGYFVQGLITFTSGKNRGKKYTVVEFFENKISVDFLIIAKFFVGDEYIITAGCDKSVNCCIAKFNNVLNFRGEPYIPNKHKLVDCN